LVGAALGVLAAIIVLVAMLPSSGFLQNAITQNPLAPGGLKAASTQVNPIIVKLNNTSVLSATDKEAVVDTKFDVLNPNGVTVILESITYDIYENSIVIGHGQVGERLEGAWQSSNYYTLVAHNSNQLDAQTTIDNTGNNPELWLALQKGSAKFNIVGKAFYNTNTVLSGQAGEVDFNFT